MKHSGNELIEICYQYYPKGISDEDPRYEETEENRHLVATRRRQMEPGSTWHRFIQERLDPRFLETSVLNLSPHVHVDACGSARVFMGKFKPKHSPDFIEFHVSFIAPYYLLYAARRDPTTQRLNDHLNLLPSEQPYGSAIVEEIQATYPGYEPLPPDVGAIIVPDIVIKDRHWGEVMLYHALFTDSLLSVPIP